MTLVSTVLYIITYYILQTSDLAYKESGLSRSIQVIYRGSLHTWGWELSHNYWILLNLLSPFPSSISAIILYIVIAQHQHLYMIKVDNSIVVSWYLFSLHIGYYLLLHLPSVSNIILYSDSSAQTLVHDKVDMIFFVMWAILPKENRDDKR